MSVSCQSVVTSYRGLGEGSGDHYGLRQFLPGYGSGVELDCKGVSCPAARLIFFLMITCKLHWTTSPEFCFPVADGSVGSRISPSGMFDFKTEAVTVPQAGDSHEWRHAWICFIFFVSKLSCGSRSIASFIPITNRGDVVFPS
jgi:hypothetical protein